MRRLVVIALVACLFASLTRSASAGIQPWEAVQSFQSDTLWNQPNGTAWSPTQGTLSGEVHVENSTERVSYAEVSSNYWNSTAIGWMNSNTGTVSITFHVFNWSGGCTQWFAKDWAGTNLPASTWVKPYRPCGWNEIRVQADKSQLNTFTGYIAQVEFEDSAAAPPNQPWGSEAKITTDTYWDGNGNYHQHYCVPWNVDTAYTRGTC